MSADNGIYILKTKDQYRVAHIRAIENLYWSAILSRYGGYYDCSKLIPTRVVEIWGDCKFTRDENKALDIAHKWASKLPACEYGVCVVTDNRTWKQILKDAQEYAKTEIDIINKYDNGDYWNIKKLQKIANGIYLSEWTNRKIVKQ